MSRIAHRIVEVRPAACGEPAVDVVRFMRAVRALQGVTVLGVDRYAFEGGGCTVTVLLAESHAALHTWPEDRFVWAELATCGDPGDLDRFEAAVRREFGVPDAAP